MKTGLITKENEYIDIPYYEIGAYAESICKQYAAESEEHKLEFELFSEKYHHFMPYLDFLLFKLGYKMLNPLLREEAVWYVKDGILYNKIRESAFKYLPVTDEALKIKPIDPENIRECVVDFNGIAYHIDRKAGIHHEEIYELILNQYLIYNKELYDIYESYIATGLNIGSFCRDMLGFHQAVVYDDLSGFMVYCSYLENPTMELIREQIKNNNPKIIIEGADFNADKNSKLAQRCIEIVGELSENRRLRL